MQFFVGPDLEPLDFTPRRLLIAGYTGRDQAAVARHVAELRAYGIPAPARTPALYALAPDRLTTASSVAVVGEQTSGEAEFVLIATGGALYVGVGSDQTDRDLERLSVPRSKQVCPKPISGRLWRWSEVSDRWDGCRLRSWSGGRLYQDGSVTELMPPTAVLAMVEERVGDADEIAVFCGTLPLCDGTLRYDQEFRAVLVAPAGGELSCAYSAHAVADLD
jgi:hypothetical protein